MVVLKANYHDSLPNEFGKRIKKTRKDYKKY